MPDQGHQAQLDPAVGSAEGGRRRGPSATRIQLRREVAGLPAREQMARLMPDRPLQFSGAGVQLTPDAAGTSTETVGDQSPGQALTPEELQEALETALDRMRAVIPEIETIWYEAQRQICAGSRPDVVGQVFQSLIAQIEVAEGHYFEAAETLAETPFLVELEARSTDLEYHIKEIVNLQRFCGEAYGGGSVRSHIADTVREHVAIICQQAHLDSEVMAEIRSAGSRLGARTVFAATEGYAQARLFLVECLRRTDHMFLPWAPSNAMSFRNAWEALFPEAGADIVAEARTSALAEHEGIDGARIEAVNGLVSMAESIALQQLEPTPERFDAIANALQSEEEVRLFMRRLNETSIGSRPLYDAFLNLAPESWVERMCGLAGTQPPVPEPSYTVAFIEEAIRRALEIAGVDPDEFFARFNLTATLQEIYEHPDVFVTNLLAACELGFAQFADNLLEVHLPDQLGAWLESQLGDLDIELPEDPLSFTGLLSIALQILGLGPAQLRAKAEEVIGPDGVAAVERAIEIIQIALEDGLEGVLAYAGNLLEEVTSALIDEIKNMLLERAVQAGIEMLMGLLAGPLGALWRVLKTAWDIYEFIKERAEALVALITAIAEPLADIMAGNLQPAADAVEGVLARLLGLAIDFLARVLGIDRAVEYVEDAVDALRSRVDAVVDAIIDRVRGLVVGGADEEEGALGVAGDEQGGETSPSEARVIGEEVTFPAGEGQRRVWLQAEGRQVNAMVSRPDQLVDRRLMSWEAAVDELPEEAAEGARQALQEANSALDTIEQQGRLALAARDDVREGDEEAAERFGQSNQRVVRAERDLVSPLRTLFNAFAGTEGDHYRQLTAAGIGESLLEGLTPPQLELLCEADDAFGRADLETAWRCSEELCRQLPGHQVDEFTYLLGLQYFTPENPIWEVTEGPDPLINPADPALVEAARWKLLDNESLSEEEVVALLQQVVHDARRAHVTRFSPDNARAALSSYRVSGQCGYQSDAVARRLVEYGFRREDIAMHSARMLFGGHVSGASHAFVALRVESRVFLIDTTLRQFFGPTSDSSEVGNRILQESGDSPIAYNLLTRGFHELDPEGGAAYGIGMAQDREGARAPEQYAEEQAFAAGQRVRFRAQDGQEVEGRINGRAQGVLRLELVEPDPSAMDAYVYVPEADVTVIESESALASSTLSSSVSPPEPLALEMPPVAELERRSLLQRIRRWLGL